MKKFTAPNVEVIRFVAADVIATSDNELPINPFSESDDILPITKIG